MMQWELAEILLVTSVRLESLIFELFEVDELRLVNDSFLLSRLFRRDLPPVSIISTAILVPLPPRHGTLLPCPQHFSLIYLVVSEENCNFVAYFKQSPETRRT